MMFSVNRFCLMTGLAAAAALSQAQAALPEEVRFGVHIRPVLSHYCVQCHGPDEEHRKADLRLDMESGLFGGEGEDRIVVQGKPKESLLFQRITTHDKDDLMPPPESKLEMSSEEIALLERWIS